MRFHRPYALSEIAERLGLSFRGNPNTALIGLNDTHIAEEGDICFADHSKYVSKALQSPASAVILKPGSPLASFSKALLFATDPFEAFIRLIHMTRDDAYRAGFLGHAPRVHPTARIAEGVQLGKDVTVGEETVIYPGVVIYDNCHIGAHCVIHAGCVIGADAFYFRKRDLEGFDKFVSCGRVVIGNHVELGALCTIDRGVTGDTFIGDHTKLDDHVHIGHDVRVGRRVLMAAQCGIAGFCVIEDDVILWGQVGVTKEVRIGAGAQVLARSGVMNDLAPGGRYLGNPAVEALKKHREIIFRSRLQEVFKKLGL
ncbi:MAG: UDP-3-O-(3-hydroxymyristoyl)glucosamine N-acyltransferase [Flavobacteriales bacterium]|nr:UDP-3-O-(3-hydroxymyristoyl)glucosamine N-acyltransferase [Flavobacteriales bacterium]MCX7768092.1 UDP-3-O-(3-hydroxymyristoyl)glucosamine N-acyltransferase [Flavobacteriales bacterium]MDW8410342.1 LpxD N-terminal domain-containing protein [Flavobacteriales bacterium]